MFFYPCTQKSYSEVSDVSVPADDLWEVVADLPAIVDVLPMVVGLDLENSATTPLSIGTRFRETRTWEGSKYTLYKTITRLETMDPNERYLSFGISFQNLQGKGTNLVHTSTLTVQPIDKTTSRLILTIAFEWRGLKESIELFCCSACKERKVRASIAEEVECYCKAAIERHLAKNP